MKGKIYLIVLFIYFLIFLLLIIGLGYSKYQRIVLAEQPIAFSHRIHLTKVGMSCNFCHTYVDRSERAGIPAVKQCIDCHISIAKERPEIRKLLAYWGNRKPMEWIRIYKLPDFVYFSHKRHVRKGVDCSECHGEVKYMNKIYKANPLKMGWCVSCHREKGASIDCLTCHK